MANAKFGWTADGNYQTYTLPVNFSWDYQELSQDDTDRERALDGTLRSYSRGFKARWLLKFEYVSTAQKEQLAAIKQTRADLDFYRQTAGPRTFTGAWSNDFDFREVAPGLWSGTMVLEEV